MKLLLSALAAIIMLTSPASAAQVDPRISGEWVAGAFRSLCFHPFEDASKVAQAVAAYSDMEFIKMETESTSPSSSTIWEAPKASLAYTNAPWLPRDLPSPQCTLSAEADPGYDHAATAVALQRALAIGEGRTKGKKNRYSTEWNFPGPNGAKRRLFLTSDPGRNGIVAKISLLNLRK